MRTKEETSAYNRAYYQKHKQEISVYKKAKALARGGWPNKPWARWSQQRRDKHLKALRNRRLDRKLKLVALLGGVCVRCGYNEHPAALEFDHIDPSQKLFGIATAFNKKWSTLLNEVKKCRLLCANCHAIRTHAPDLF